MARKKEMTEPSMFFDLFDEKGKQVGTFASTVKMLTERMRFYCIDTEIRRLDAHFKSGEIFRTIKKDTKNNWREIKYLPLNSREWARGLLLELYDTIFKLQGCVIPTLSYDGFINTHYLICPNTKDKSKISVIILTEDENKTKGSKVLVEDLLLSVQTEENSLIQKIYSILVNIIDFFEEIEPEIEINSIMLSTSYDVRDNVAYFINKNNEINIIDFR